MSRTAKKVDLFFILFSFIFPKIYILKPLGFFILFLSNSALSKALPVFQVCRNFLFYVTGR